MTGRRTGVGVGVGEMERFGRRHSYLEVFKACRLCGSGGGYKMPIVQASPPQHLAEPELRHKIRDCCSIDVRPNDKMPPLICELCVDKVNDFFEFREMCRATNSKVRTSLGLPPQTLTQELSEDCILGVSGPVIYVSKESDEPARARTKPALKRGRRKADAPRVSFQDQVPSKPPPLPAPAPPSPSPQDAKRSLRHAKEPLSLLAERMGTRKRERSCVSPQPLLEKRPRFSSSVVKKVETVAVKARAETRRAKAPALPPLPPPPPKKIATPYNCIVCKTGFTKQKLLTQHLGQMHSPAIFSDRMGCAPCREWFASVRLADDHHKWHKTSSVFYSCWRCSAEFKLLQSYNKHFALRQCIPEEIVPDPVCDGCHKNFATENLKSAHRCAPAASGDNSNAVASGYKERPYATSMRLVSLLFTYIKGRKFASVLRFGASRDSSGHGLPRGRSRVGRRRAAERFVGVRRLRERFAQDFHSRAVLADAKRRPGGTQLFFRQDVVSLVALLRQSREPAEHSYGQIQRGAQFQMRNARLFHNRSALANVKRRPERE